MIAQTFTGIHNELQAEQFRQIDSFIDFLKRSSGALRKMDILTVLHQAKWICGSISKDIQFYIAEKLNVDISDIEATINFYEYFTKETQSEHIRAHN